MVVVGSEIAVRIFLQKQELLWADVDTEGIAQHRHYVPNLIETFKVEPEMNLADYQAAMIYSPYLPLFYALCPKNV
jgi:hypothetical protein